MSTTDNDKAVAVWLPEREVPGGAIREAAVSTTVARRDPTKCPMCGNATVMIEGQFRREFSEELVEGNSQGFHLAPSLEKNILAYNCANCKVRYIVEPDEMFGLRAEIVGLEMTLAEVQRGITVIPGSNRKQ